MDDECSRSTAISVDGSQHMSSTPAQSPAEKHPANSMKCPLPANAATNGKELAKLARYLDELVEEMHLLHRFCINNPDKPHYIFALTFAEIHRVWKRVYSRVCEDIPKSPKSSQ